MALGRVRGAFGEGFVGLEGFLERLLGFFVFGLSWQRLLEPLRETLSSGSVWERIS